MQLTDCLTAGWGAFSDIHKIFRYRNSKFLKLLWNFLRFLIRCCTCLYILLCTVCRCCTYLYILLCTVCRCCACLYILLCTVCRYCACLCVIRCWWRSGCQCTSCRCIYWNSGNGCRNRRLNIHIFFIGSFCAVIKNILINHILLWYCNIGRNCSGNIVRWTKC